VHSYNVHTESKNVEDIILHWLITIAEIFITAPPNGFKRARLDLNVVEITADGTHYMIAVTVSDTDIAVVWRLPFITQLAWLCTDQSHWWRSDLNVTQQTSDMTNNNNNNNKTDNF